MHVDIHITDDSFPMNVDVAYGGSVTWYNDDTDAHVIDDMGRQVVWLPAGRSGTIVFDVDFFGRNQRRMDGRWWYRCYLHQGMEGHVTIHS